MQQWHLNYKTVTRPEGTRAESEDIQMMANIVAIVHSARIWMMDTLNHIAIVQDVDGYHNHFLYDEDKGKGAAGTGPFKTIEDAKQDVIAHYPDAKEKKISPAGYRYYSTQRPIMPEDTRSQKITKSWRLRTSTIKSLLRK